MLYHLAQACSFFKDLFYGFDYLAAEVYALYVQTEEGPYWIIGNGTRDSKYDGFRRINEQIDST